MLRYTEGDLKIRWWTEELNWTLIKITKQLCSLSELFILLIWKVPCRSGAIFTNHNIVKTHTKASRLHSTRSTLIETLVPTAKSFLVFFCKNVRQLKVYPLHVTKWQTVQRPFINLFKQHNNKINVAEFFVYDFSHSNNSINIQQALASKERKGQGTNKKNQGINT